MLVFSGCPECSATDVINVPDDWVNHLGVRADCTDEQCPRVPAWVSSGSFLAISGLMEWVL